jgi:DNA modification methylase
MLIKINEITIAPDRQRKEIDPAELMELSDSIAKVGLIHPVVIRTDKGVNILVAGERRIKAMETIWAMGNIFTFAGRLVPEDHIPSTRIEDLDPLDAMEIELEENLRRSDLSWQDEAKATSELYELRRLQAEKAKGPEPTNLSLSKKLYPDLSPERASVVVREGLVLARNLSDPDVAKATSRIEGLKVIRRKEEAQRQVDLGVQVGRTFGRHSHQAIHGDCLEWLKSAEAGQFDVILTDPPYGIDAQDFNDSGGKANAAGHTYDDSYSNWLQLIGCFSVESYRLAKPEAHAYVFCDVDRYVELRSIMSRAGWRCFRTPFIWYNPTSQRAPWPQCGPHRRYQMCLYAVKGNRRVLKLASDLVEYKSDENLGWAAQKPVALYSDFLARSCRAGDAVLDPFCGSGTIFPAAHALKIKATGIERDPVAYGIAVKRIGELK